MNLLCLSSFCHPSLPLCPDNVHEIYYYSRRGSQLYVYGGVTELGDVEVALDDCWSLDLGRRSVWKRVLRGSMHTLVWKGEDLDGTDVSQMMRNYFYYFGFGFY